jgi:hypothetical protein
MFCLQCGNEVKDGAKLITECHAVALWALNNKGVLVWI